MDIFELIESNFRVSENQTVLNFKHKRNEEKVRDGHNSHGIYLTLQHTKPINL